MSVPEYPYVRISRVADGFELEGSPGALLGNRLETPGRRDPEGIWCQWSWDGARLTLRNDRYGMFPVYYWATDRTIAISPSIGRLLQLGAPGEFDDHGIAAYLRLGFFLGEDTPFRAIRALPPNATVSWPGPTPAPRCSYMPRRMECRTRQQVVDGYVDLFRQAVAQRLPTTSDRCVLPLSGGRDSRHIAFELNRQGVIPALCVTQEHFAERANEDLLVGKQLCEALGWTHRSIPQVRSRYAAEVRKNRLLECCSDEHAWFLPTADVLNGEGFTVCYDGLAGDALSQIWFLSEKLSRMVASKEAERFLTAVQPALGVSDTALYCLLNADYRMRWGRGAAIDRLTAEFARIEGDGDLSQAFFFWNRTRREIVLCMQRMLRSSVRIHHPYLDHDLFDFLWATPGEVLWSGALHDEVIAKAFPPFSSIPFENKNAPLHRERVIRESALFARALARDRNVATLAAPLNWRTMAPRMLRALLSPSYAESLGWMSSAALWMIQLRDLSKGVGQPLSPQAGTRSGVSY